MLMTTNKTRHDKWAPSRWYVTPLFIAGMTLVAIILIVLSLALGVGPDPDMSIFLDQSKAP
jgi:hypothetical protein